MDRVMFWNDKIIKRHHVRDPAWDTRLAGKSNGILEREISKSPVELRL